MSKWVSNSQIYTSISKRNGSKKINDRSFLSKDIAYWHCKDSLSEDLHQPLIL